MTVVLSMNPLCTPHHRLRGSDDVLPSPDLTFNFVTSPPRTGTPVGIPTPEVSSSPPPAEEDHTIAVPDKRKEEDIEEDGEGRGVKRKLLLDNECDKVPTKRVSPFLNTPKQRKDERKKVLRISVQKLRQMEDPEHFLRRSVLINNTVKRMQSEIREEKRTTSVSKGCPLYKRKNSLDYEFLNTGYLSPAQCFDEPLPMADDHVADDDITDALVQSLETGNFSSSEAPMDNFITDTQREKQIYSDMDMVFNNLIRSLGET